MASPDMIIITPKEKDIGAFAVRRALPDIKKRAVGPFVFFDHFGPVTLGGEDAMDVRPHPHINLATVTYLFEGQIQHRDSLATQIIIHPGAINLMVAGRGIAHSERTPADVRRNGGTLHGLQLWLALPEADEQTDPAFYHYPKEDLPSGCAGDADVRVMMGAAFGLSSPVKLFSPTLYVEATFAGSGALSLPQEYQELAIYAVDGTVFVNNTTIEKGQMGIVEGGGEGPLTMQSNGAAHCAVIGGSPLGRRHLWWNFVSSDPARIDQAKQDWREGRFGSVPGETDFIPLPDK
ncbi:MAG: pirin family protein [Pseudomonadota bacterium]